LVSEELFVFLKITIYNFFSKFYFFYYTREMWT